MREWIVAFDPGARRAGFAAFHPTRKRFHLYNINPLRVKIDGEWRQTAYNKVTHNWWVKFAKALVNRFDCYMRKARIIIIEKQKGQKMSYFTALIMGMCAERYEHALVYEMDPKRWRNYCGATAARVKASPGTTKRMKQQMQHAANKIQSSKYMEAALGTAVYEKARAKFGIKPNAKEHVDALEAMMMAIAGYGLEKEITKQLDTIPGHSAPKKGEETEVSYKVTFDPHDILARNQTSARKRIKR